MQTARTLRWSVFVLFLLAVLFIVGPLVTEWARGQYNLNHLGTNSCRMELTPHSVPGYFWQEHRHYLEATSRYTGPKDYSIMNAQTGFVYYMGFEGNIHGQARFSVRTRLTWFYPQWNSSSWILLYNC